MASEAGPIREPVDYPEHDDLGNEDILVSEGTIADYIVTASLFPASIRS
jgi:hypothetical protein